MIKLPVHIEKPEEIQRSRVAMKQVKLHKILNNVEDNYDSGTEEMEQDPVVDFGNEIKCVEEVKEIDMVFLVETTEKMTKNILGVKNLVRQIMRDLENFVKHLEETSGVMKFGLVLYRDKSDQDTSYWTKTTDLTSRIAMKEVIMRDVNCEGGEQKHGDVVSGLRATLEQISWREGSEKFLFHVVDTAPRIDKLSRTKVIVNDFESEIEEIFTDIRDNEIDYNIVCLSKEAESLINLMSFYYDMDVYKPEFTRFSKSNL